VEPYHCLPVSRGSVKLYSSFTKILPILSERSPNITKHHQTSPKTKFLGKKLVQNRKRAPGFRTRLTPQGVGITIHGIQLIELQQKDKGSGVFFVV